MEESLIAVLKQYHNFDMEKLKTDVDSLTEKQIERVNEQEAVRLA